jgi:hypothetical protein
MHRKAALRCSECSSPLLQIIRLCIGYTMQAKEYKLYIKIWCMVCIFCMYDNPQTYYSCIFKKIIAKKGKYFYLKEGVKSKC